MPDHEMNMPLKEPFTVGRWLSDPSSNVITHGNELVSLEPKAMDLLTLLAAAPGRVFSREELDAALWPDVTVGEDTLARAISKLRRALGDKATAPEFIETIPKRGYRLIAQVGAPARPSSDVPAPFSLGDFLASHARSAYALGITLIATIAIFTTLKTGNAPSPEAPIAIEATERGNDLYMRFSRADNEAAIVLFERAIAADPTYAPAQAGLANALVQRAVRWQTPPGAQPSAISLADALANGITQKPEANATLARAVDLGNRAVRLAPQDADAFKALGFAYSAQGRLDRAREEYERAVMLDAEAWEAMINLGELASIEDNQTEALKWLERAYDVMDQSYQQEPQRIGPWRAPLGVVIGEAYEALEDHASAEAWYRRVLDQAPLEPEATTRLANILRTRGDAAEATRLCKALTIRVGVFDECDAS